MIEAVTFLDQSELPVEICRFPLHESQLFVGDADASKAGVSNVAVVSTPAK